MKVNRLKTSVYIDVSNIRFACEHSLGLKINFKKLYDYLSAKYPNCTDIRFYEGISSDDKKKEKYYNYLRRIGYTICPLVRKSYIEPAIYRDFACKNCGQENTVQVLPAKEKLKSNVDVYLAADMLVSAAQNPNGQNIILFSCDGDYAEAIKDIIKINRKTHVFVFATPMTKSNNSLSIRLKELNRELDQNNFTLLDISRIEHLISQ